MPKFYNLKSFPKNNKIITKITKEELRYKQGLPIEKKIELSERVISEWYEFCKGMVYISFSGGLDSTVLLHLVRDLYGEDIPAVFSDTGLEYPEIRSFVKTIENVIWVKSKMNFQDVIKVYGYPVVSKKISQCVARIHSSIRTGNIKRIFDLLGDNKKYSISNKWIKLLGADFKISDYCCEKLKKQPIHNYTNRNKIYPFLGNRVEEGGIRVIRYLQNGCNAFSVKNKYSAPLSFWLHSDIVDYIDKYNLKYSKVYDMGYERTGCMFCCFGVHIEKHPNRFERMKVTHPKHYDYCIKKLNLGHVLDFIGVSY